MRFCKESEEEEQEEGYREYLDIWGRWTLFRIESMSNDNLIHPMQTHPPNSHYTFK